MTYVFEIKHTFITMYWYLSIIGPFLNYYPQYLLMDKNNSVGSFTPLICYITFYSSMLKIIYYLGHSYDWCILAQSIFMLIIQFVLLRKFFEIDAKHRLHRFSPLKQFSFITSAFFCFYVILFLYLKNNRFVEITGNVSSFVECLLPTMQFFSNYKNKSVKSLSYFMIFFWFLGDIVEFCFLIIEDQPVTFIWCSLFQIFFEILIILQLFFYQEKEIELEERIQSIVQIECETNLNFSESSDLSKRITDIELCLSS